MNFRILHVFDQASGAYILARQLHVGLIAMSAGVRLGGVDIQPAVTQPRAALINGHPDRSVFSFHPVRPADITRFRIGDLVKLEKAACGDQPTVSVGN